MAGRVDRGGDLTIGDGEYCSRCSEADALDCMAIDDCPRRRLARQLVGLLPGSPEIFASEMNKDRTGREDL